MAKQNNQLSDQQCHKKQVRRRLHTSRPYQERLLNMAEARKEIVTALKFHRAAMRKTNEKKQPQPQSFVDQHPQYHYTKSILGVQDQNTCSPIFKTIPSNMSSNSISSSSSSDNDILNHAPNSYPWFTSSTSLVDPTSIYKTLDIALPNQPLGLNLNLQAFTNLNTPITTSTSSPSPSSWSLKDPAPTTSNGDRVEPISGTNERDDHVHLALDEEEMEKIRSIGEQHQIEWDDTLDLVKSPWWFKFIKSLECGKEMKGVQKNDHDNYNECHPFGDLMEFPSWLSANNESFLQQNLDEHYFSEDYGKDDALPWMDIGDIDGMDDEWLSQQ